MSGNKRKQRISLDSGDRETKKSKERTDEINKWTNQPYSSKYYSILEKRTKLPVYAFKEQLTKTLDSNQVIVVEGETGSGKVSMKIM